MTEKVLVTGANGFIGRNLCEYLENKGVNLTKWDIKLGFDVLKDNIPSKTTKVYHLACLPQMASTRDPMKSFMVNAWGTRRMAEQCKALDIPLVYTSTLSVYGNPELGVVSYDSPKFPKSDYAVAKLAGENYLRSIYPEGSQIVRLSNVYGPWQDPNENPECGIVGKFVFQALSGISMTVIGDGSQARDFTYVGDVVSILAGSEGYLNTTKSGMVYYSNPPIVNLGSGIATSIRDLAWAIGQKACLETTGSFTIVPVSSRPIDNVYTRRTQGDGFRTPTSLSDGLDKTIKWFIDRYKM